MGLLLVTILSCAPWCTTAPKEWRMARMSSNAVIAVNRFGLGAAPGEVASAATDPRGWLATQARQPAPAYTQFERLAHSSEALKEYPRWIAKLGRARAAMQG